MDKSEILAFDSRDQERLTGAIRRAVASVERRNPGCLRYNGIPLRGAVERRLYYEALMRPASLEVLCKAGSPQENFLEWLPRRSSSVMRDALAFCKAWARLIYYGLYRAQVWRRDANASSQKASNQLATDRAQFVFWIVHPRFIGFFLPIIDKLGRHRCVLMCDGDPRIVEEAARHQLTICPQRYVRLRVRAISGLPRALFPVYSINVVQLLKALGSLQRCRPRVVVFAEAASYQEEVVARAARSLGIATVRVQHGRAGVLSPGYYDMPYDKMLMWGEGFADRLKPISPDCKYYVTGSPLRDNVQTAMLDMQLAAFMQSKPTVTVISQPECANISRHDYAALASVVDGVLRSNEVTNILVRLHPADAATDFHRLAERWSQRMRVTRAQDFALNAVLARTTVIVGLYSTVLSEAVALGVVPVVIRFGERHRIFPSPEDAGAAVLVTSADAAVAAICELVSNPSANGRYQEKMRAFTRAYFGLNDGGATARIARHIEHAEPATTQCREYSPTPETQVP